MIPTTEVPRRARCGSWPGSFFRSRLRQGSGFRWSNDSLRKNPEDCIDVTPALVANNHLSAKMGSSRGKVRTPCTHRSEPVYESMQGVQRRDRDGKRTASYAQSRLQSRIAITEDTDPADLADCPSWQSGL